MKSTIAFMLVVFAIAVHAESNSSTTTLAPSTTTHNQAHVPTRPGPSSTSAPTIKSAPANTTTTANVTSETKVPTVVTTVTPTTPPTTTKPGDYSLLLYVTENNKTCILLRANISMIITYMDDLNKSENVTLKMDASDARVTGGSCGEKSQFMAVTFGPNNDVLTFVFGKDKDLSYLQKISLDFTMDKRTFPHLNSTRKNQSVENNSKLFEGTKGMPYMCKSNVNSTLNGTDGLSAILSTCDFEYAAFRTTNSQDFKSKYVNCPMDAVTSNIVPIAVGAALAALVVIVLIAYLISRNRNKRGYESV